MRLTVIPVLLTLCLFLAGCRSEKPSKITDLPARFGGARAGQKNQDKGQAEAARTKSGAKPARATSTSVVRVESPEGKVAWVNHSLKFVVLDFSLKPVPELNSKMFLYRAGRKMGEVRITGPVRDNNIAADLLSGDAEVGDEARPE